MEISIPDPIPFETGFKSQGNSSGDEGGRYRHCPFEAHAARLDEEDARDAADAGNVAEVESASLDARDIATATSEETIGRILTASVSQDYAPISRAQQRFRLQDKTK
jgi:hypothetical protein